MYQLPASFLHHHRHQYDDTHMYDHQFHLTALIQARNYRFGGSGAGFEPQPDGNAQVLITLN